MVKIADFGLAIQVDDDQKNYHGFAGTPAYMSPEIIKHEPYGKPVDLWSCGVVLYVLLVGDLPFWHEDKHDLYSQIKAVDYKQNSDEFQSLSIDAKDLINKLINLDPNTRINAKTALNHHWIQVKIKFILFRTVCKLLIFLLNRMPQMNLELMLLNF